MSYSFFTKQEPSKHKFADQKSFTDKQGNEVYLTAIDETHVKLSYDKNSSGGMSVYHIDQLKDQPFYKEAKQWLQSEAKFSIQKKEGFKSWTKDSIAKELNDLKKAIRTDYPDLDSSMVMDVAQGILDDTDGLEQGIKEIYKVGDAVGFVANWLGLRAEKRKFASDINDKIVNMAISNITKQLDIIYKAIEKIDTEMGDLNSQDPDFASTLNRMDNALSKMYDARQGFEDALNELA